MRPHLKKNFLIIILTILGLFFATWGSMHFAADEQKCSSPDPLLTLSLFPECAQGDMRDRAFILASVGSVFWYLVLRTYFWKKSPPPITAVFFTVVGAFLVAFFLFALLAVLLKAAPLDLTVLFYLYH